MANILEEIVDKVKSDVAKQKRKVSFSDLSSFESFEKQRKSFSDTLRVDDSVSIIAEIKKGSPSKGIIRHDFDPEKIADSYIKHGASAISVLTNEPFFKGALSYLEDVSSISPIPVLRKDFLIDPYQVKEAAAYGADALLLIATICSKNQLSELLAATKEYGMQALVECYHEEEVDSLNWEEIEVVGVNNRDLTTFSVDLHRGIELLQKAPEGIVRVSESGITSADDLFELQKNDIHSALIGEHFMRETEPGEGVSEILDGLHEKMAQLVPLKGK